MNFQNLKKIVVVSKGSVFEEPAKAYKQFKQLLQEIKNDGLIEVLNLECAISYYKNTELFLSGSPIWEETCYLVSSQQYTMFTEKLREGYKVFRELYDLKRAMSNLQEENVSLRKRLDSIEHFLQYNPDFGTEYLATKEHFYSLPDTK